MTRCPAHGNRIQLTPSRAVNLIGATTQPDCRWIQAQLKGFYLTGALGGNWPQAANVHKLNTATPYGFQEFHNSGVSIEAGLGYDFGQLRSEITYSYDTSLASSYSDYSGVYDYSPRADVVKNNALVSLYWDIPLST
jgi:hypothetical protein